MARNNNNFLHKKTLITANSVDPSAVTDQAELITTAGGLTTAGLLQTGLDAGTTFMNYDDPDQFTTSEDSSDIVVVSENDGDNYIFSRKVSDPFNTSTTTVLVSATSDADTTYTATVDGVEYDFHEFTTVGDHTFTVTSPGIVDVLLVGGGGGGGYNDEAGGGGGGEVTLCSRGHSGSGIFLEAGTYTVTVAAGGAGGTNQATHAEEFGAQGGTSSFAGLGARGGGGGAAKDAPAESASIGGAGANGGGSGSVIDAVAFGTSVGGPGTSSTISDFSPVPIETKYLFQGVRTITIGDLTATFYSGNDGGGADDDGNTDNTGGGGGAGGVGGSADASGAGPGGVGIQITNFEQIDYYYGGGGSGIEGGNPTDPDGTGGSGGGAGVLSGGTGGRNTGGSGQGSSGGANTGGGGTVGTSGGAGGDGGSGIVVIRYETSVQPFSGEKVGASQVSSFPYQAQNVQVNLEYFSPTGGGNLIRFLDVDAGADSDFIHSYQILDSATNPAPLFLTDEVSESHYLTVLDEQGYPTIDYSNNRNLVRKDPTDFKSFTSIAGLKLANVSPTDPTSADLSEFSFDSEYGYSTRDIGSRFRFRTRKSVPSSETGGAPGSYGADAPEGPIGLGVGSPTYSKVSNRFQYRVYQANHVQGAVYGYANGGGLSPTNEPAPFVSPAVEELYLVSPNNVLGPSTLVDTAPPERGAVGTSDISADDQAGRRSRFPMTGPYASTQVATGVEASIGSGVTGNASSTTGYVSGGGSGPLAPDKTFRAAAGYQGDTYPATRQVQYPFASDGTTVDNGEILALIARHAGSATSTTHGYLMGGEGGPYNEVNPGIDTDPDTGTTPIPKGTIEPLWATGVQSSPGNIGGANQIKQRFPFSGPTAFEHSTGNLSNYISGGIGNSSATKGYLSGLGPGTDADHMLQNQSTHFPAGDINEFTFAAPGAETVTNNPNAMFYWGNFGAAQNSGTHGYLSNGTWRGPSGVAPANVLTQDGLGPIDEAHNHVQKFPFSGPTATSAVQQTTTRVNNNNGWSSGVNGFISGATNRIFAGPTYVDDVGNLDNPLDTAPGIGVFTSVYVFPFASDTTKKAYDNALFAAQRSAEGWL